MQWVKYLVNGSSGVTLGSSACRRGDPKGDKTFCPGPVAPRALSWLLPGGRDLQRWEKELCGEDF